MEKQKEVISITHFINPHLFWYHKVDAYNEDYRTILEIEKELAQYYIDHQGWIQAVRYPIPKALVAVKFLAWNKIIRARVDHVAGFGKNVKGGEYIMWAIDYGFPFQTKADQIYRLPQKLTTPINYIRCGGLANILPAEEFYMKDAMVKRVSKKWHQRACEVVEKAINDAETIVFVKECSAIHVGQEWGELIIKTNMGVKYRLREHLISLHLAVDADANPNYQRALQKLETNKILPWMCNSGNTKFYTNRAYLYPAVIGMTHNGTKTPAAKCNDMAKQKVEEWYVRNQITALEDDAVNGGDGGFLDATSEHTDFSIIGSISPMKRICDQEELCLTKIDEYDDENQQHMQLAGVLSKSRMEKYSKGKVAAPPPPRNLDFDMRTDGGKTNANHTIDETTDSEISAIKYVPLEDSTVHNSDIVVMKPTPISCINALPAGCQSGRKIDNEKSSRDNMAQKDNTSTETAPITSDEVGAFAGYLIEVRNQYLEKKEAMERSTAACNKFISEVVEPRCGTDLKNFNQNETNITNQDKSKDLTNTFYGMRMIPAGYDIMNLHNYNDEGHWHCKKSTMNDRVPHNHIDLLDYAN